ncbi:MAG: biotin carboxylase N-terminal domain-containing protein [Bacteroidales bacterium]
MEKSENPHREIRKVLVANRGEIARRIIRAVHALGKEAVAVYAGPDRDLPHVEEADEAWSLGEGTLARTYLNGAHLLEIARQSGADALHPGYGFLSENAGFAAECRKAGLVFIGPDPDSIAHMGEKVAARDRARALGIPVPEGFSGTLSELREQAPHLPYPVLIKPSAGGGGKGMRIVHRASDLIREAEESAREARNYFGSDLLLVEQYLPSPRHVEVQVLGDRHGNLVHLFERDCSLQRRYQKIIEEAPSPTLSGPTREKMTAAALELARDIGYVGANGGVWWMAFLFTAEMGTRIQVEHPVTETVTGIDLVQEQIRIAEGPAAFLCPAGHPDPGPPIEARVYAEDPLAGFLPSPGGWSQWRNHPLTVSDRQRVPGKEPRGKRNRSWSPGNVVHGSTPGTGTHRFAGLGLYRIAGPRTNRDFLVPSCKPRNSGKPPSTRPFWTASWRGWPRIAGPAGAGAREPGSPPRCPGQPKVPRTRGHRHVPSLLPPEPGMCCQAAEFCPGCDWIGKKTYIRFGAEENGAFGS